jgi:hypothetical protein
MAINWLKILAVTGTSFFTTLIGILTIDALTQGSIPWNLLLPASFLVAAFQGGLAFCRELTAESEQLKMENDMLRKKMGKKTKAADPVSRGFKSVVNGALRHMVLF